MAAAPQAPEGRVGMERDITSKAILSASSEDSSAATEEMASNGLRPFQWVKAMELAACYKGAGCRMQGARLQAASNSATVQLLRVG